MLNAFSCNFIDCTVHACATSDVKSLVTVKNEGYLTSRTNYHVVCIWHSIGVIFLKLHITLCPRMR
jgi:hypothetical protein